MRQMWYCASVTQNWNRMIELKTGAGEVAQQLTASPTEGAPGQLGLRRETVSEHQRQRKRGYYIYLLGE